MLPDVKHRLIQKTAVDPADAIAKESRLGYDLVVIGASESESDSGVFSNVVDRVLADRGGRVLAYVELYPSPDQSLRDVDVMISIRPAEGGVAESMPFVQVSAYLWGRLSEAPQGGTGPKRAVRCL